jgi:hypothetical protein
MFGGTELYQVGRGYFLKISIVKFFPNFEGSVFSQKTFTATQSVCYNEIPLVTQKSFSAQSIVEIW